MGEKQELNYYFFAYDDYLYFKSAYNRGEIRNGMAAQAQNICERFLKQIVSDRFGADDKCTADLKKSLLRTHSLNKLLTEIKRNTDIEVSADLFMRLSAIDGYYFTTRYPGEESVLVTRDILEMCNAALEECKKFTDKVMSTESKPEDKCKVSVKSEALRWCREHAPEAIKGLPDSELWDIMKDSYYNLSK